MLRLYLYARVRISHHLLHARPRVQQAPGIPCALLIGRNGWQSPGETRRGNIYGCRGPRRRATQYSRDASDRPMGRGVLDTPPEPVIGLAKGETRWRGMTDLVWGKISGSMRAHCPE